MIFPLATTGKWQQLKLKVQLCSEVARFSQNINKITVYRYNIVASAEMDPYFRVVFVPYLQMNLWINISKVWFMQFMSMGSYFPFFAALYISEATESLRRLNNRFGGWWNSRMVYLRRQSACCPRIELIKIIINFHLLICWIHGGLDYLGFIMNF